MAVMGCNTDPKISSMLVNLPGGEEEHVNQVNNYMVVTELNDKIICLGISELSQLQ